MYSKDGVKLYDKMELTITGLVLHCGFASRQSFYAYEKKPEFSYIIKRARTLIEKEYELCLRRGLGAGAIFALKNFGWTDRDPEFKDDSLNEDLDFAGMPTEKVNGRFKKYYHQN